MNRGWFGDMKFQTAYFLVLLLLSSAVVVTSYPQTEKPLQEKSCYKTFVENGFEDAYECNNTILRNLTNRHYNRSLKFAGGSKDSDYYELTESFSLHCCFFSLPYCPVIQWFKDGKELRTESGRRLIRDGGRTLEVSPSTSNGGNYICTATSPYQGEKMSRKFRVKLRETCKKEVYAKPDAHQQSNRVVKQGTEQKFSCSYFCNGNYINGTVNWKNRTGDIIPNNTKYQQRIQRTSGGNGPSIVHTLTVTNVEESDDDFTCILNQPNKEQIKHTFHLEPEEEDTEENQDSFLKGSGKWIVIAVLLLMIGFVVLLSIWLRWNKIKSLLYYIPKNRQEDIDTNCEYDAFVSYSETDGGSFVRSTLVPMLEDECKYKLSLHYRDFIPGEAIMDNIAECVHRSRKILTVVTPGFLKSEWCRFEVDQGLCHAVKRPNTLIVIILNEMALSKLPRSLQTILNKVTYLVWDDHNLKKMREKLNRALDSPTARSEPDITIC